MTIEDIRKEYHSSICHDIIRIRESNTKSYLNFADGSNRTSCEIAEGIVKKIEYVPNCEIIHEQTAGDIFENVTKTFISNTFKSLQHIRPGNWGYSTEQTSISQFDQYDHLKNLDVLVKKNKSLRASIGGDYIVKPDIIIARTPLKDSEINKNGILVEPKSLTAKLTPLRMKNQKPSKLLLHAVVSCKWTIRSDRSQNTRTEALNLIRNRKGHSPHIVAVTAEPLPTRIASLAMGTGDIDCVYHFALTEMEQTLKELNNQDQLDIFETMVEGKRLRDISDLPFDLSV